jgi:hypothetical protein
MLRAALRARGALPLRGALLALLVATGCGGGDEVASDGSFAPSEIGAPAPTAPRCDVPATASDALGTTPGSVTAGPPTLEHLTAIWEIAGDENENATVEVRVRPVGGEWRAGLALRRTPAGTLGGVDWPNRFSGSLFGLKPGTSYEVELFLSDPDGGCAIKTVEMTTRTAPAPADGARIIAVTPASFDQLASSAIPGDVLELGEGTYPGFTFLRDGTPGEPIVIRGTGATITGDVNLTDRKHVILDGVTVVGGVILDRSLSVAVVGTTIRAETDGITIRGGGGNQAYIADNLIEGRTEWEERALGAIGENVGEGILVNGAGHVVEHNRVVGFADGISLADAPTDLNSFDVLRNDISEIGDDAIEADYCEHNCRIVENRITNAFIGLSSQPGLGGPTYFVRNAMYNLIAEPIKLHNGTIGDVIVHNTSVKNGTALNVYETDPFSRQLFRNNLFLGGPAGVYNTWSSGTDDMISLPSATPSVDMDYDGFGSTLDTFTGRLGTTTFTSIDELRRRTTEKHAIEVEFDVFADDVAYPASPFPAAEVPDLRLADDSAAIDAGETIPGLNDRFTGDAPDLGAYELGADQPAYGPRE